MKRKIRSLSSFFLGFSVFSYFFLFLVLIFLSSCELNSLEEEINLKKAELIISQDNLSEEIDLEKFEKGFISGLEKEAGLSLKDSLVLTINNLAQLQKELKNLNFEIDKIDSNLNKLQYENNLNYEMSDFISYLNSVTEVSKSFTLSLYDSSLFWEDYLNSNLENSENLDFTKTNNSLISSFINPLWVFYGE